MIPAYYEQRYRRSVGKRVEASFREPRRRHRARQPGAQRAAAKLFRCSIRVRVEKKLAHLARRIA
jgi:hypothetical protein